MKIFFVIVFVAVIGTAWFTNSIDSRDVFYSDVYLISLCKKKAYDFSSKPSKLKVFDGALLIGESNDKKVAKNLGNLADIFYKGGVPKIVKEYSVLLDVEDREGRNKYGCFFYKHNEQDWLYFHQITGLGSAGSVSAAEVLSGTRGMFLPTNFFTFYSHSKISFEDKWNFLTKSK